MMWLTMKYDTDKLTNGEAFDTKERGAFRLKFCGSASGSKDPGNCFTTGNIEINSATNQDIEALFTPWLETTCRRVGTMQPLVYHGEYETGNDWPGIWHFRKGAGAWCGRRSHEVHNHDIFNRHISTLKFRTNDADDICFAYKGKIDKFYFHGSFDYTVGDSVKTYTGWMKPEIGWYSATWKWSCTKITEKVNLLRSAIPELNDKSGDFYDISHVRVWNRETSPIYIDELWIGRIRGSTFKMEQTNQPLSYDGQVPNKIHVAKWNDDHGTQIRFHIDTWDDSASCGYFVPLPSVLPPSDGNYLNQGSDSISKWSADWRSSNYEGMYSGWTNGLDENAPKDVETMTLDIRNSDGSGRSVYKVHVVRQSVIDPAFTSDVFFGYGNSTSKVKFRYSGELWPVDFRNEIQTTWPELGSEGLNVNVWRSGWCNIGYTFTIQSTEHGIMKKFSIEPDSNGHHQSAMGDVEYKAVTQQEASVYTHVLPGSVIATEHHVPQVVIIANGQRSACDNCDFRYSNNLSPYILSVVNSNQMEVGTVTAGETVIVRYDSKGYDGIFKDINVTIGGISCDIIATATSEVTCIVGKISVGEHRVVLDIPNLGVVKYNKTVAAVYNVQSYSPNIASSHGGAIVTVLGSGFVQDQVLDLTINSNSTKCNSTGYSVMYDTLICATALTVNTAADVTPKINAISKNTFTLFGNEVVTITGELLKSNQCFSEVIFGSYIVSEISDNVISWTETEISLLTPIHGPGVINLKVNVCTVGYSNEIPVHVELVMNSVSNSFSSLMGGKRITITGAGFYGGGPQEGEIYVFAGNVPCLVDHALVTYNQVVCTTGPLSITVDLVLHGEIWVTSAGTDGTNITIEEGQVIAWSWNVQLANVQPKIRFQQVTASEAVTSDNTYWSQELNNDGTFRRQFSKVGTYFYSTGYIDSGSYVVIGTVNVVEALDKPSKIHMKYGEHEAIDTGNTDIVQPIGECERIQGRKTTPIFTTTSGLHVIYSWLVTPSVIDWSHTETRRFPDDAVNIRMDVDSCIDTLEITVGYYNCKSYTNEGQNYSCTIDHKNQLDTRKNHSMVTGITAMGYAYHQHYTYDVGEKHYVYHQTQEIQLKPKITNITPKAIGPLGDVTITISGLGFYQDLELKMYDESSEHRVFPCVVIAASYSEMVCHLPWISSGITESNYTLSVRLEYESEIVFSTQPLLLASHAYAGIMDYVALKDGWLEVYGMRLDHATIYLNSIAVCNVSEVIIENDVRKRREALSVSLHICELPMIESALYQISASNTYGPVLMTERFTIEVPFNVLSVSTTSGGIGGGSRIKLTGNGFSNDIAVLIFANDGKMLCKRCEESNTFGELYLVTPPVDIEQQAIIVVTHETIHFEYSFNFTYLDTTEELVGNNLDHLHGGEALTISIANPNCDDLALEIGTVYNACSTGQHECSGYSECKPTDDLTDYSCICPNASSSDNFYDGFHGAGLDCRKFLLGDKVKSEHDAFENCGEKFNSGWRLFEASSKYAEQVLANAIYRAYGDSNDGTYFSWHGSVRCAYAVMNDTEVSLEFIGNSCGETFKRPICEKYSSENCYENNNDDYGQHTYSGRKTTSISGKECLSWKSTTYYDDHKDYIDRLPIPNVCRNIWNGERGIQCPVAVLPNGDIKLESCGIPQCHDIGNRKLQQQCTIRSAAPLSAESIWRDENGDSFDIANHCFIGSHNHEALNNPRKCFNINRYIGSIRLDPIDVKNNKYRIVRNRKSDNRYIKVDLQESRSVRYTQKGGLKEATVFSIEPTGDHNTYTIRTGDYFLVAPDPISSSYILALHETEIQNYPTKDRKWIIECTSDDYGSLSPSSPRDPNPVTVLHPSCDNTDGSSKYTVSLPSLKSGIYTAIARTNRYGRAMGSIELSYDLMISNITPNSIGVNGHVIINVEGHGFSDTMSAYICDTELQYISFYPAFNRTVETDLLVFETVPFNLTICNDMKFYVDRNSDRHRRKRRDVYDQIQIDESITPAVVNISPPMGGTAGGTRVTITGNGFGIDQADVRVTIDEIDCPTDSVNDTIIVCITGPKVGTNLHPVNPIIIIDGGPGRAILGKDNATFWYVDRWSSPFTWGCTNDTCLPKEGEIVVIPTGQTILLDITTPVLAVLVIDGGTLLWDRQDGIELHIQYGIVNSGGRIEIGTEENPFCPYKATMVVYGHQRSINLPIYGAKVLAVRFGSIDIYGCPITTTWTELNVTA